MDNEISKRITIVAVGGTAMKSVFGIFQKCSESCSEIALILLDSHCFLGWVLFAAENRLESVWRAEKRRFVVSYLPLSQ
jgi:hypothetical protein